MKTKPIHFVILTVWVFALLIGCTNRQNKKQSEGNLQAVKDMAGRDLTISNPVKSIISNNLPGTILLYSLADSMLIARNNTPSYSEPNFCTKQYVDLPLIGSWFSTNGTRNTEEVIRLKPDLIVSAGNIGGKVVEITDRDQEMLKIPMMLVSTDLTLLDSTYQLLGKLLNREEKAAELIEFYQKYIPLIISETVKMDSANRKRIYIAMGQNGLLTPPASSLHSQVTKYAGALNVAEIDLFNREVSGHATVSLEQVIKWAPDIILTCGIGNISSVEVKNNLLNDRKWAGLTAIKKGQVFEVPASPYLWLDRPPSINQIMGVIWLAKLLYPDHFSYDIKEVTREFYTKFYHRELAMTEINKILNN